MTNDEQVEQFENMVRKHNSRVVNSENVDIPDDLLNYLVGESTKKEAPRTYKKQRKHFTKAQLVEYSLAITLFVSAVGGTVLHSLAKSEYRDKVDPVLTEQSSDVGYNYKEAFKKNDINVFFGFTPDGNKNIERDSSRNYRFMNEYFDGNADIEFFEYLVSEFGIDEVLKGGISVSRCIKGVADQNDITVKEFLNGLSVKEWAENMYNGFAEEHVPSVERKGL